LKNIGKKMKTKKKNKLYKEKFKILNLSKKIIILNGWNQESFFLIGNHKNINKNKLNILFPNGYIDLLYFALDCLNDSLLKNSLNLKLLHKPLHKKVREILLLKIKIMEIEKKFYKKCFFFMLNPVNKVRVLSQLYKSVDLIWYISGDNSTDFNYYSKRIILAGIYFRTLIHFFNNNNIAETEMILDKSLSKVKKIPILKDKLLFFKNYFPKLLRGFSTKI